MLIRCILAENRKLHGAVIWLVFLVVPMISALYGTFNFLQNLGLLTFDWYNLWTQHTLFYTLFFFAPMVGVYTAYLWRLEHLGHNWNLIMTVPVRRSYIFLAKFLVVAKMTLLTQGWVFLLYLLAGKFWAGLPGWPPVTIVIWLLRGVLGSLGVIAFELLLAMAIRSFAVPVLVGLAGGVSGMLAASRGLSLFWPFALMQAGMNSNRKDDMLSGQFFPFLLACLVWAGIFAGLAILLLRVRDVRAE